MRGFVWKVRYAYCMVLQIVSKGSVWRDVSFAWSSACASWPDFGDENPVDCAESEMSYWQDDG